ncbi:hypothetical protein [Spirosoma fluminis]
MASCFFLPLIILVVNLLFLADEPFTLAGYLIWSAGGIAYELLMWEISMRWLLYVRRRDTGIQQTRRRVLITFVGYLLITSSLQAFIIWFADVTRTNSIPITGAVYIKLIAVGFFSVLRCPIFYRYVAPASAAVMLRGRVLFISGRWPFDRLFLPFRRDTIWNSL